MPDRYEQVRLDLRASPRVWLVTGVAGFIGSNLMAALLALGQTVVGLDNFATGHRENLDDVLSSQPEASERFRFIEGDMRDPSICRDACGGVDFVLHQAALGSVPRSIADPATSAQVNIDGLLNVLIAARDARVKRVVFASSSSVYGDARELPQREDRMGQPLSPYAVTKVANELFATVFQRVYDLGIVGLRYFNVFGPRQDPEGPYAAVIPRWVSALLAGKPCRIYGDGETSRDFSYIANTVQANLLAATAPAAATGQMYNIACGESTSLNTLFRLIRDGLARAGNRVEDAQPVYDGFRPGDIARSMADISRAQSQLGYQPEYGVAAGLDETLDWYMKAREAGRRS